MHISINYTYIHAYVHAHIASVCTTMYMQYMHIYTVLPQITASFVLMPGLD